MQLLDRPNGTFTTQEIARLAAYRAAVAAGFYSDWDGSSATTDTELLAWLPRGEASADGAAYPFTPEELQRLQRCRAAVDGGGYADDRPPAAASATPGDPDRSFKTPDAPAQ